MTEPIETQAIEPDTQLALRPVEQGIVAVKAKTAQELRILEVSEALLPAYQKASTLELTDDEINALMAPFPDEMVEIRPHDGLIYIPHIHISDRLNRILKPGKWALVCRRHWLEGSTMYAEYVLLIRGCYVGESVGGHAYQPNNPKTDYSDSLESTAGEALRRIAGKRLSCGSQVWNPEYARQWQLKHAEKRRDGRWYRKDFDQGTELTVNKPLEKPNAPAQPYGKQKPGTVGETATPKYATYSTRAWLIEKLKDCRVEATDFFVKAGMLLETEALEDLPLRFVPIDKDQMQLLMNAIGRFAQGEEAGQPFPANPEKPIEVPREKQVDLPESGEEWRTYPMPWGNNAGVAMEELDKKYLFGLWANYQVEDEYNGKPKKPETIAKDRKFREMLDLAGEHYHFEKKD